MKEYLTDEELNLLIEQLEQQELYAPKHMKDQILSQAFPERTVALQARTGGGEKPVPDKRKAGAQIQSFSYRLKIVAGMAAALLMLAILPMQERNREYPAETESWLADVEKAESDEDKGPNLNRVLNGGMRRTSERLNAWIGRIDHLQLDGFWDTRS